MARTKAPRGKTVKKGQYFATSKYFKDREKRKIRLNLQKILAEEREIRILNRYTYQLMYMKFKFMELNYKLGKARKAAYEAQARKGAGGGAGSGGDSKTAAENMRLGLSMEEVRQIFNISPETSEEEIHKHYGHLLNINDKVNCEQERLDQDLKSSDTEEPTPKSPEGDSEQQSKSSQSQS